jgi:hypothetical protein
VVAFFSVVSHGHTIIDGFIIWVGMDEEQS